MRENLGYAVFMIRKMLTPKSGITIRRIVASSRFKDMAMIRPPTSMPGLRSAMRRVIMTIIWICCRSLVSLVTREPVEKSSRSAKEKVCTLAKRSLRRSPVKPTAERTEKYPPSTPPMIMIRQAPSIRRPMRRI